MNVVWGSHESSPKLNDAIGRFVAERILGGARGFQVFTSLGVVHQGSLVAGVVYHDWNPEAEIIELSAASDDGRWLTRPVLSAMFSYPFDGIGCQMVVLRVSGRNENASGRGIKRIAKAYGFTAIPIPRLYGRDHDGVLLTLTDDAWRTNRFHKG